MKRLLFLAAGSFLAIACSHQNKTAAVTTTGAMTITNADAVTRITNARCDRELACNDVGPGKRYADRDSCSRTLSQTTMASIRADQCVAVDEQKLEKCLSDIQGKSCGSTIGTLDDVSSCQRDSLCMSSQ